MRDGYLSEFRDKHIFITNTKRKKRICITKFVNNLTVTETLNFTSEMSFTIDSNTKYKYVYDLINASTTYMIDGLNEYVTFSLSEEDFGTFMRKTVECRSSEHKMNDRNVTLVNTSASYVSLPLYDNTNDSVMKRVIEQEMHSWSVGNVDLKVLSKIRTFKGMTQQNILKLMYEEIENAYDCIPFFNTLNHTISFRDYETSIDDTGIIVDVNTLIKQFGKVYSNDANCTKMYVTGKNIDIRRVTPHGLNFVFDYSNYYDLMSNELRTHLQLWLNTCKGYEAEYKTVYLKWAEAQTEYETLQLQFDSLDAMHTQMNQAWAIAHNKYGEGSPEEIAAQQAYWDWVRSSGFEGLGARVEQAKQKANELLIPKKAINDVCKRENFLTTEDLIELDEIDKEVQYKQDAFYYAENMIEENKSDIAFMLKEYADEEIKRCNKPRFDFTCKLANICTVKGFENFASQLNIGKYIRVIDSLGNMYKVIIVKITVNKDNPQDIDITFSDKMTGHKSFPKLNEYINKYWKAIEEQEMLQHDLDELRGDLGDTNSQLGALKNTVNNVIENIGSDVSIATRDKIGIVKVPDKNLNISQDGGLHLNETINIGTPIEGTDKRGN